MGVVKQGRSSKVIGQGGVLDLRDIERTSRAVLDRARAEAERIRVEARSTAESEADARHLAAFREGFQRGLEEGRATGAQEGHHAALAATRNEVEGVVAAWTRALDALEAERKTLVETLTNEALELAMEIARRVVRLHATENEDAAAVQVAHALEMLGSPAQAVVVIHPEDRAIVEKHLAPLAHRMMAGDVRLVEDASVGRGGCIARAAGGEVEAAVEPMLDRVAELLRGPAPEGCAA